MEEADRKTIMSNIVTLRRDMNFADVYPSLLARDVFEKHHIEKFDSKPSDSEKNMALLMAIQSRGSEAFTSLVESLVESKQVHLAMSLGYQLSGSSQGEMGQVQATAAHENRPALFGQPSQQVPPVPANDGHGDYSSTQMNASGSYPQTVVDSGLEYKMKSRPRGIAVIINNKNFNTMRKLGRELKERKGTDVDREKLKNMFVQLQFQVFIRDNCTGRNIKEIIEQMRNYNHSSYDCFILAILSHGKKGDAIYGTDGDLVTLEYIMDKFGATRCPTLSGKPKLFFVQACRGGKEDEGVPVNAVDGADNSASTRKMPSQSDMFLAYSTVPGYVSWRNYKDGGWFVQALTDVIPRLARSMDLGTMMTRVNYKLSRDFESNSEEKYKQISAPVNMLTKDLYFFSKQERENFTYM